MGPQCGAPRGHWSQDRPHGGLPSSCLSVDDWGGMAGADPPPLTCVHGSRVQSL